MGLTFGTSLTMNPAVAKKIPDRRAIMIPAHGILRRASIIRVILSSLGVGWGGSGRAQVILMDDEDEGYGLVSFRWFSVSWGWVICCMWFKWVSRKQEYSRVKSSHVPTVCNVRNKSSAEYRVRVFYLYFEFLFPLGIRRQAFASLFMSLFFLCWCT